VCGAYEGGLTTDCPGESVSYDRQKEVYETPFDYTDDRGWHMGESMKARSPRFEETKLPPTPPPTDPRKAVSPGVDWAMIDRHAALQYDLTLKAIAWVMADRACEERSVTLARVEDETAELRGKTDLTELGAALLAALERAQIDFRLADKRAQKCDDEFRQVARQIVAGLEARAEGKMLFTRTCGCTVVAGDACPHFVGASKDPAR
jgi:hypothetical protein